MKLDTIVYDYSTLQNAIATTLNSESSTFQAIYPSDTATSLVNVMAAYGSMLEYQIVSAMANAYTDSAYSKAGIYQLAETLGNRLHGNISSEIYCDIERTNLKGISNVIIPSGSKFMIGDLNFFNPNSIVFPLTSDVLRNIKLVQGLWQTAEFTASGISGEKIYFCNDFKCNTNLVKVFVNDVQWEITDSFLPYVITDTEETAVTQVVILRTESDGRSFIKFGNNTNGIVPSAGTPIRIEYVYNEGADGNLGNTDVEVNLISPIYYVDTLGVRTQLTVDITPVTTASGGFNTQSLEVLKESSPYVFASGQRAVRRNDYKSMLLNHCGYLTCNVWGEYEEAAISGGYDKIMMNMVYYTGIKSIKKYDLQPVTTLNLNLAEIQDTSINFYNIDNNIASARGFLGSYVVDISSFDANNNAITLKYRDALGTGILTCDPSINSTLNNFEEQIFPINDLLAEYEYDYKSIDISTNQKEIEQDTSGSEEDTDGPIVLITGGEYKSSGVNKNNQPVLINFDNPFQIKLDFKEEKKSITAFAFKTSATDLRNFMHQFAIYGTNEKLVDGDYDNVKNNKKWTKLTGMQTFSNNLSLDSYTDWVTTNVYVPGKSETRTETFDESKQLDDKTLKITELIGKDYVYKVKIDGITQPNTSYHINTINNTLSFVDNIKDVSKITLYGTLNDWEEYYHYVIEIYSIQDGSSTTLRGGQYITMQQIKALFRESSSTINYTSNNNIKIQLPTIPNADVIDVYTIPRALPYANDWISLENKAGQTPLYPEEDKVYFVNDQNTYNNTIELIDGGTGYAVGEEFTLCNYKLSYEIDEPGELYKVNEIIAFSIGQTTAQMKVTEVNDVGGLVKLEFLNGTEYTGNHIVNGEGSTPNYYGSGRDSRVIFTTQDATQLSGNLKLKVLSVVDAGTTIDKIETFEITDGEGNVVSPDQEVLTHYRAIGNNIEIQDQGESRGRDALFRITGKQVSIYNKQTIMYDTYSEKYIEDGQNIKSFGLPYEMQYYLYNVSVKGFTQTNGYTSKDVLSYTIFVDNYMYTFTIRPNNIDTQDFNITLEIDDHYPTNILRGKSSINVQDMPFTEDSSGENQALITISSESTVNVYGSYTGNYYTNVDIQAADLPIIDKYNHFTTYLEFKQPHIKNINIELNVEYENVSTYQDTKAEITKAIFGLFDIKPYSIGAGLNVSDVWKAVNNIKGIKRFNVVTPIDNIDCMPYELIVLPAENLIINDIITNNGYK